MKHTFKTILCLITYIFFAHDALATSLSVALIDRSTGSPSSSSGITYSNYSSATETSPWILADQYLHIEFDCDYSDDYWGLRIITDNMEDVVADTDGDGVSDDEPVGVEDESGNMHYGGIVKVTLNDDGDIIGVNDDPAQRIILSWQVYDDVDATSVSSITVPTVSDEDSDGIYTDDNVSTNWYEGDWAYIADKSDDNDYPSDDSVLWVNEDGNYVLNYSAIAYGAGFIYRTLVPHPDIDDRGISDDDGTDEDGDGDIYDDGWDIYVFIAGRFWNTAYVDTDADGTADISTYFQLPGGDYRTRIYIEIFHE